MSAIAAGSRPHGAPPRLAWAALLLVFMIGIRVEVGGDWFVYLRTFTQLKSASLAFALEETDPAYGLVNWLVGQFGLGFWAVNVICAAIFTAGLIRLARCQPNPQLALLVSIPYLVIVVAMGYTRQSAALGLIMLALTQLLRGATLKMVASLMLAAAFHKSAVIAIPLILVASSRKGVTTAAALILLTAMTYYLFLAGATDKLMVGYIKQAMKSSGAAVRIAMNAVPAALFLGFRKRFGFDSAEMRLWVVFSLVSLLAVIAIMVSPYSTAIDRLAIYLIPVQIVILSRLPVLLGGKDRPSMSLVAAVVAYSLVVELVWLNFGQFSWAWLPYQNYLWTPARNLGGFHRN